VAKRTVILTGVLLYWLVDHVAAATFLALSLLTLLVRSSLPVRRL
jgi:hypothetical protein